MASNSRVIVVGGGVIGCSIAYHLAGVGVEVTLVERGKVGGGASGVAAGMIAALSEAIPVGHTLDLALMSRALLLDMLPQLQQESGIDVEYLSSGILHVAFTEEEETASEGAPGVAGRTGHGAFAGCLRRRRVEWSRASERVSEALSILRRRGI